MDGCRKGWLLVTLPAEGPIRRTSRRTPAQQGTSRVLPRVDEALSMVRDGVLVALALDIPIGLAEDGTRPCDRSARSLLGPRSSSVFPAPARAALSADPAGGHAEACRLTRELCGRGLSIQSFSLLGKIAEVDRVMTPGLQRLVKEVHPELSFAAMAGAPMRFYKKTPTGREERLCTLRAAFGDLGDLELARPAGADRDDVLDAFAAAWSARRVLAGRASALGGERDARGLRMEIVY